MRTSVSEALKKQNYNANTKSNRALMTGSVCGSQNLTSPAKSQLNNHMEKKYCAAPWRGVHINFRGDVKTCCAGDPNMLGKITDSPIEDILTSAILQEIRTSIKNGKLHTEYCSNCIDSEIYGSSERHWHNDVNDDFDIDKVSATTTHRPV